MQIIVNDYVLQRLQQYHYCVSTYHLNWIIAAYWEIFIFLEQLEIAPWMQHIWKFRCFVQSYVTPSLKTPQFHSVNVLKPGPSPFSGQSYVFGLLSQDRFLFCCVAAYQNKIIISWRMDEIVNLPGTSAFIFDRTLCNTRRLGTRRKEGPTPKFLAGCRGAFGLFPCGEDNSEASPWLIPPWKLMDDAGVGLGLLFVLEVTIFTSWATYSPEFALSTGADVGSLTTTSDCAAFFSKKELCGFFYDIYPIDAVS